MYVSIKIFHYWEFPGDPVIKTRGFPAVDAGSIPGQGTKIPQAVWWGKKKKSHHLKDIMPTSWVGQKVHLHFSERSYG